LLKIAVKKQLLTNIISQLNIRRTAMMNMETFFKNHFNTSKISDDNIRKFTEIHLQRTSANNDSEKEETTPPTPKISYKGVTVRS
jgi:hypothetical protein